MIPFISRCRNAIIFNHECLVFGQTTPYITIICSMLLAVYFSIGSAHVQVTRLCFCRSKSTNSF